ncbi:triacylglycerol lipase [Bifidobacterium sp. CP2]|uniref:esterase/lipase family protein n=1 Tax=Bifidobacterium sp. CP2 TaxID=2809025 RepID=UPI001BDC31D6|nr:triacylglycerol lipase [Bifidobacterium sp. CP2]MBT1180735.1 triacylglycerol lipase [Bifidobacterium sp. CP2]
MTGRISACRFGVVMLRIFWWTTLVLGLALAVTLATLLTVSWPTSWGDGWPAWTIALVLVFLIESVVFWTGIITVYLTSVQLGLKIRVIGILCGWIPIANLVALHLIIRTVAEEVRFESAKERLDRSRAAARVCATRYPVLLVHGVFFRDTKALNYWGRVPAELERNGATIYYGEHQSAASVADSAQELTARIRGIVETTGCGKVNVIAHSKGGLDMRYAIARCGAGRWVASLTTINTPHRGCGFADYLLTKIPAGVQRRVASAYNAAASHLGDKQPDFMAAVHDLTQSGCARLNGEIGDGALLAQGAAAAARPTFPGTPAGTPTWPAPGTAVPQVVPTAVTPVTPSSSMTVGSAASHDDPFAGIVCRSVGSKLAHATTGKFPLNFTYPLVKWFDGPNDGLVSLPSFPWGESFTWLEPNGVRGISHADMIDLNRENIPGFDVREFYVQLVADLKRRGL